MTHAIIETNGQIVYTLRDGDFKALRSDQIVVGDLVSIRESEVFPADLILLASSNQGFCHIQTSSLDGEKNLKKRTRPKDIDKYILNTFEPDRILFVGECESEHPNTELYQYTGKITICGENFALNANQLLLKGAVLKNTDWVLAFVLYTGKESKLMMNSQQARFKSSRVEQRLNKIVVYNVLVQVMLCIVASIVGSFWNREYDVPSSNVISPKFTLQEALFLTYKYSVDTNAVLDFFSYFLLLGTLIPISLIVTLEIVKVIQAYFIINDVRIYSQERDRKAKVSSTSIVEELGQINYIFSDKTGTLTRNVMEFKLMNVGGVVYGDPADLVVSKPDDKPHLERKPTHTDTKTGIEYNFKDENLEALLKGEKKPNFKQDYKIKSLNNKASMHFKTQRQLVTEFLKVLALAHECVPEVVNKSDGTKVVFYQGPSPDEVTLVDFAKSQGFDFQEANDASVKANYTAGEEKGEVRYEVLRKMEFNSDRKRMSIVIRDPKDGLVKMYTKGADSIIKERLDPS